MDPKNAETAPVLESIAPKTHFRGKVQKTSLAGALVEIGSGKTALLHISRIVLPDKQTVKQVSDVLKIGDEIDVWVKRAVSDRIELTMIKPLDLEWKDIKSDMTVKGTIVKIESFGAFVEIGAERPAMIHISEISNEYIKRPEEKVKIGDVVEAKVLEVDRKKKQIKLSMKCLIPEEKKENEDVENSKKGFTHKKKTRKETESTTETPTEPELTVMEMAMQIAVAKAKGKKAAKIERVKREKNTSFEQEEIFTRTLEQKELNK